jgi:hypothetical protein
MAEPAESPVRDALGHTRLHGGPDGSPDRSPRRSRLVLLCTIAVLYVISVPWYRDPEAELRIVFGLPDWAAVALACYVAVALLNGLAWLRTEIDDDAEGEGS